jgi:hypothetical protein
MSNPIQGGFSESPKQSWLSSLNVEQDWLYKRLADPSEGWSVNFDETDFDVPLNKLDAAVYKVLLKTIDTNQKIAITLPRIKPGVTLSLVAYLVVNRLIKASGRFPAGFSPVNLNTNQRVFVLTKNKKLRDFFLGSSLNFGSNKTLFSDLSVERLNRLGKFQPIGRKVRAYELFAPVTFYHFENIDELPTQLDNSIIIAEFTESDSAEIVNRFISFIQRTNIGSALVLLNSFDKGKISALETNQFHFVNFDKNTICSFAKQENRLQMPSLASSLSYCPSTIELETEFITDDFVNQKLQTILAILMKTGKDISGNKPFVLQSAWNIFYNLKNLAVPLSKLEDLRKKNAWLKSIRFNLDKIFNMQLSIFDEQAQEALRPVWGTLKLEFNELYSRLFEKNEKFDLLEKMLLDPTLKNETAIVFSGKMEAEIFKQEMFINHEWVEDDHSVQVRDLQQMLLQDEIGKEVILAGAWRSREISKIIALMPKKITILCYPSESQSILSAVRYINIQEPREGLAQTQETLSMLHLTDNLSVQTPVDDTWIIPTEESQKYLEEYKAQRIDNELLYDELGYENFETEPESNEVELENTQADDDEPVQAYRVELENDATIFIATDQQIFVYSNEEENVQTVFPESLQVDDMVLLYSHEQNQEMFQEMLRRTRELTGANQRYITLWKNTVDLVRKAIDERYQGSYVMTIKMLRRAGCQKNDVTIRQWFKGLTMAPRDKEDIKYILEYCVVNNGEYLAEKIHDQMEKLRFFNRKLGVRLKRRLSDALRSTETAPAHDRIEQEIDEILESAEIVKVKSISHDPIAVPKTEISKYIF